ncbi:MAG: DNA repair protein RecN [Lachnospiraceae bacterium]|nr:DNA repair protein RecN [Lachnospiraceae bacterium]
MLVSLHVKNFAIIDEVEVIFKDHLNILTGETGAGKSIIIGSINVALGGKVSKDMVRKGADYALVELIFQSEQKNVIEKLKEYDLPVEEGGQILISRKIMPNGRTISKVNGENVINQAVKEIATLLLDIHGQHEHQSLLYKTKHLALVDHFAKDEIGDLKADINALYKEYKALKEELDHAVVDEDKRLREISFMEYEINEITAAKLIEGEDEELQSQYRTLSHANAIVEGMSAAYLYTAEGSTSAADSISRAVKQMTKIAEYDENIGGLLSQLSDIESMLYDFNRGASEYIGDLGDSKEELTAVEQRLDMINHMKSKYGSTIEEINNYCKKCEEKVAQYNDYDAYLLELKHKIFVCEERLETECGKLSDIRKKKAAELTEKMKTALIDLNFLDVQFEMVFDRLSVYTSNGYDDAEFVISTNPGESLKPLSKVASGGELSRIMLAMKSVMAEKDEIGTLIFDEIDVGVSGRTAQKVSEKLSVIANNHQILCITHLPQIAAMADAHYVIEKKTDQITTKTDIKELSESESVEELARILGGAVITANVMTNAREMKTLAKSTKHYVA